MVAPVLRHRIQTSYEADARGIDRDAVVKQLLDEVKVPATDLESDPAVAAALGETK